MIHKSPKSPTHLIRSHRERQKIKAAVVENPDIHGLNLWVKGVKDGSYMVVKHKKGGPVLSSALSRMALSDEQRQYFRETVLAVARRYERRPDDQKNSETQEARAVYDAADALLKMCTAPGATKGLKQTPDFRHAVGALAQAVLARDALAKDETQDLTESSSWLSPTQCSSNDGSQCSLSDGELCPMDPPGPLSDSAHEPLTSLDELRGGPRYKQLMEQARATRRRFADGKVPPPSTLREAFVQKLVNDFLEEDKERTYAKGAFLNHCCVSLHKQGYRREDVLSALRQSLFDTSLLARLPMACVEDLISVLADFEQEPWKYMVDLDIERAGLIARIDDSAPKVKQGLPKRDIAKARKNVIGGLAQTFDVNMSMVKVRPAMPAHFSGKEVARLAEEVLRQWLDAPEENGLLSCLRDKEGQPMSLNTVFSLLSGTSLLNDLPMPVAQALIDAYARASGAQQMGAMA